MCSYVCTWPSCRSKLAVLAHQMHKEYVFRRATVHRKLFSRRILRRQVAGGGDTRGQEPVHKIILKSVVRSRDAKPSPSSLRKSQPLEMCWSFGCSDWEGAVCDDSCGVRLHTRLSVRLKTSGPQEIQAKTCVMPLLPFHRGFSLGGHDQLVIYLSGTSGVSLSLPCLEPWQHGSASKQSSTCKQLHALDD